jgi:hypothetical protein
MSREIGSDPSKWSDDDIAYLRDRGRLPAGFVKPEEEAEETEEEVEIDLNKLSVDELKEEARARDLSVGGNKADLIDRILEYDQGTEEEE